MKTNRVMIMLLLGLCLFVQLEYANPLITKQDVLNDMVLATDYWMSKNPSFGDSYWMRASYFIGHMASYRTTGKKAYYDYAVKWAEKNNWSFKDAINTTNGDNHACSQTYIELYQIDKQPKRLEKTKLCIDTLIKGKQIGVWGWIDAFHMAAVVYAKLGTLLNDTSYYGEMYKRYKWMKKDANWYNPPTLGLHDTAAHLWYRDGAYAYDKNYKYPDPGTSEYQQIYTVGNKGYRASPNGKKVFWSRGVGWVVVAHARILEVMPKNSPYRKEFEQTFIDMCAALLKVQTIEGYWNPNLADPYHCPSKETSGTGFFTYGFAWGINSGYLDSATYAPAALKAWQWLSEVALNDSGRVGWAQAQGQKPENSYPYKKSDSYDWGVGAFLLAGSEIYKLLPDSAVSISPEIDLVHHYSLSENCKVYYNLKNSNLHLTINSHKANTISLSVYNVSGKLITRLCENKIRKGKQVVSWLLNNEGDDLLPSGTYLYQIQMDSFVKSGHFILCNK